MAVNIDVGLLGVNLVENENVLLGTLIKINSVNNVLILVKQTDQLTDEVNKIIEFLRASMLETKTSFGFSERLKRSKSKILVYTAKMHITHGAANIEMIAREVIKRYMRIFNKFEVYQIVDRKVTELSLDKKPVEVAPVEVAPVEVAPVVEAEKVLEG